MKIYILCDDDKIRTYHFKSEWIAEKFVFFASIYYGFDRIKVED